MSDDGRIYLVRRELIERRLADSASNPAVRAIHAEMADRYAALAKPSVSVAPELGMPEVIHLADRRGMLVRAGLADGLSDAACRA